MDSRTSKYSDCSISQSRISSSARFMSRRDMILNRSSGQADASPRRISDLRKMEFGTDLHSRLAFINWASKWLYRAGLEKKNKNSLIMDLKDVKMQSILTEDVETEILKKIEARRASEIASANPKQWKNINDQVRKMSHEMIEIKALCDSSDADGVVEKFNEIEEQNQARMTLLVEQENKMDQLRQEILDLQAGVRKISVTGNICDRPSCDTSSNGPIDRSFQLEGGKKRTHDAEDKLSSTLDTHKSNLRNIYNKIRSCLEAAGDVSDCLDDRLGPDKEVTEKTVFECLAGLNESVDQLLTVKAYFDYRAHMGTTVAAEGVVDTHSEKELPPINNPFLGNLQQLHPGPKKLSAGANEPGGEAHQKSRIMDKDLPYCQLQGEKKTNEAGMDEDRSSILVEDQKIRKNVTEKIRKKTGEEAPEASSSDSAGFRYLQAMNSGGGKRQSLTTQMKNPSRYSIKRPSHPRK